MKEILKYIFILVAIVFVVGIFTFVAMFISYKVNPNSPIKIFGYTYFSFDINKKDVINQTDFNQIEISSTYSNIEVKGTTELKMNIEVKNKMLGVAKLEEEKNKYDYSYVVEDDILKISIKEPKGLFVNTKSASITVNIPTSIKKDIVVNTQRGSINIGNAENYSNKLNVNNVTINAKNNSINVKHTSNGIKNLAINSSNNFITIKSKVNEELNIKTKTSSLSFDEVNKAIINSNNLKISGNKINSDFEIKSSYGILDLTTLNGNLNIEGNIKTNITTLNGSYQDSKRTGANLKIGTVTGTVNAKSTSGTTTILNCNGEAQITSTNGNITVKNVKDNLTINSNSGLCTVDFANNTQDKLFTFESKNGSITANNISARVNINIKDGGICAIKLNYNQINGENVINGKKGKVTVSAPVQQCIITVNNKSTKQIEYGDVSTTENVETIQANGATAGCTDKLLISSTSGKIIIKAIEE